MIICFHFAHVPQIHEAKRTAARLQCACRPQGRPQVRRGLLQQDSPQHHEGVQIVSHRLSGNNIQHFC